MSAWAASAGPGSSPPPRRGPWPGTIRWPACAVPARPRRARRRGPSPPGGARRRRRSRPRCPVPPSRSRPPRKWSGRNSAPGALSRTARGCSPRHRPGRCRPARERRGDLLPRAQPLVRAEPADLGHQPHHRGDLGLRRRVTAARVAAAPGRWPGHGAVMTVSPPVSAVHSSSVTNGMTGWSSRSSASSTYPSTSRVVWPA